MKASLPPFSRIRAFLVENRLGLLGFLLLWSFGLLLGRAVFIRAFLLSFRAKLPLPAGCFPAGSLPTLAFGLLPALLYCAAMLLSARVRAALPLWALAVLAEGCAFGFSGALALLLARESGAWMRGLPLLLPLPPLFFSAAALALLPFPRLRRGRDPFGNSYACEDVLAFLPWMTGYGALRLLSASLPVAFLTRGLFH